MLLACVGSHAADAARGAQLYMRTDADIRSCVSCHGPDPGTNHNNILRAADNPDTLTKVLNTVSQMGFLRSQLSDTDRADITAFLGTINRLNAPGAALRMWPVTLDFGQAPIGAPGPVQSIRLANASSSQPVPVTAIASTDAQVQLQHDCPLQLAPSASCDIQLRVRPSAAGLVRAAVSVTSPAFATPVHTAVAAAGTSAATSQLGWLGNPTQLAFQATGTAEVQQTLVLTNPGPMPATLGLLSIAGPDAARFRIEKSSCTQGAMVVAGTSCELTLAYMPSLLPSAQAVLQLRSDQANPPSVRLEGEAHAGASQPDPLPVADSGGGCSTRPPGPKDPILPLALMMAALAALVRRRAQQRSTGG
ncbi:MAG: cytochrome c [Haliea sp.]|nr:MAG: cytochrome c [Haliea sp.]